MACVFLGAAGCITKAEAALTQSDLSAPPPTENIFEQHAGLDRQDFIFGQDNALNEKELVFSVYKDGFIKWVDFNANYEILKKVYQLDVKYHNTDVDFDFIEVLAYLAAKNGNSFNFQRDQKTLAELVKKLENKETTVSEIYGDNKYYKYYLEAYTAIFKEFIGEYTAEDGRTGYGLKAYSPVGKGFWFSDYDDFGNKRSYGFKRRHLGHDLMGSVGAPIIAIEGGTVTELGWNRYGGWRIGIRSFDTKRYYYYAHLRKDRPFAAGIKKGDKVEAGQVIGYLGMTGYSSKENVNMKNTKPHLHLGLQLIFDESQVKGSSEIWIDMYAITRFLALNKAEVKKDAETKEYKSINLKKAV